MISLIMRGVPPRAPRLKAPATTRLRAKSYAIIAALGAICGLDKKFKSMISIF